MNDKIFIDKQKASEFIKDILKKNKGSLLKLRGEFNGLKFYVGINAAVGGREEIVLAGKSVSRKWTTQVAGDNINRIIAMADNIPEIIQATEEDIAKIQKQIADTNSELNIPFPQEEELQKFSLRSAEISAQLDLDSDKFAEDEKIDEKERRLNNIFSTQPQNFCQKKFFAIVKLNSDNNNDYSPKTESVAVKKLLEADCSFADILDTLYKFSPIVSEKEDIKKIIKSVASQLQQSKLAAGRSAGR